MTKELTTTGVLEKADKFNLMAETGFKGLALCLPVIEDKALWREAGYQSFVDYYTNHLGKSKGWISKLSTVGRFALSNGFSEETLGVATISSTYAAINVFEDKDPQYVLAAAQTNTVAEILQNKREEEHPNCAHKKTHACTACDDCGNHTRTQQPF